MSSDTGSHDFTSSRQNKSNVGQWLINPKKTIEGKWLNFFNWLCGESLFMCNWFYIGKCIGDYVDTGFCIGKCIAGWPLAAFAFASFPFPFISSHFVSFHFIPYLLPCSFIPQNSSSLSLYLLPPLLITSGSEAILFTTPLLIATPHSGTTESCNDTAVEPSSIIACSSLFLGLWPFHRAESLLNFMWYGWPLGQHGIIFSTKGSAFKSHTNCIAILIRFAILNYISQASETNIKNKNVTTWTD